MPVPAPRAVVRPPVSGEATVNGEAVNAPTGRVPKAHVRELSAGERLHRARRIGVTVGRTVLGLRANRLVASRLRPADMPARWSRFHRRSAESIYDTAVDLRGLVLKGCQFLGTRADVMPPEYVEVLSRLHDRVPPCPFAVVRRCVEGELGFRLEDVFASFEPRPLASASLAQVHRAVRLDGREVAVKVQYPEIESLVRSDLANLRMLIRAVGWLERDFDLLPLIDELARTVPLELDFVNESHNARRMRDLFRGRDDLAVPEVHEDLVRRRVLVMDLVSGVKVDDPVALRAAGVDPDRVAELVTVAYAEQLLVHGFFHADPHPGNLLVQPTPAGPRLVLLDFGLAKELPRDFRHRVLAFATALLRGDADAMTDALQGLGFETRDGSRAGIAELARYVLASAQRVRAQSTLDRDLAERLRAELPERIRANPLVRVPPDLVLVGRVVALLSGIARSLGSRVDVARLLLPYALDTRGGGARRPPTT